MTRRCRSVTQAPIDFATGDCAAAVGEGPSRFQAQTTGQRQRDGASTAQAMPTRYEDTEARRVLDTNLPGQVCEARPQQPASALSFPLLVPVDESGGR